MREKIVEVVRYSLSTALHDRQRIACLTVIAVVALRLISAASFGPIQPPDTGHYLEQADCLFKTLGAQSPPCPDSAFKAVGYGFVIAGAMVLFGSSWALGIVALQIALSLLASFVLARLTLALSGSFALALLTFAMHNLPCR
jgi:hypothetical protein